MAEIMHTEKFVSAEHEFFNELYDRYQGFDNYREIERGIRAVFNVLRDIIPIQESFHLLSQLPSFLKLYYIEGWKYREKPIRIRAIDDFIFAVEDELIRLGELNYDRRMPIEELIAIILTSLDRYVDDGEFRHIMATLPPELYPLFLQRPRY